MVGVKPHVEIGLMEEEKKEEEVPSIPGIAAIAVIATMAIASAVVYVTKRKKGKV